MMGDQRRSDQHSDQRSDQHSDKLDAAMVAVAREVATDHGLIVTHVIRREWQVFSPYSDRIYGIAQGAENLLFMVLSFAKALQGEPTDLVEAYGITQEDIEEHLQGSD